MEQTNPAAHFLPRRLLRKYEIRDGKICERERANAAEVKAYWARHGTKCRYCGGILQAKKYDFVGRDYHDRCLDRANGYRGIDRETIILRNALATGPALIQTQMPASSISS